MGKAACDKTNKAFVLELDLWGAIDSQLSTYSFGSVGRVNINLKKGSQVVWRRLLSPTSKRPGNMHTWWKMQAKHDSELAELGRLNQESKNEEASSDASGTDDADSTEATIPETDSGTSDEAAAETDGTSADEGATNGEDGKTTPKKKKKKKKKKKEEETKKKKKKSKDATGD